jgi:hypothetical protein
MVTRIRRLVDANIIGIFRSLHQVAIPEHGLRDFKGLMRSDRSSSTNMRTAEERLRTRDIPGLAVSRRRVRSISAIKAEMLEPRSMTIMRRYDQVSESMVTLLHRPSTRRLRMSGDCSFSMALIG